MSTDRTCHRDGCDTPLDPRQRKYCSRDCYNAQRQEEREERRQEQKAPCENPGCEKLHLNKRFCSETCANEWKTGRTVSASDQRICDAPSCDTPHDNARFCSPECMWEGNRQRSVQVEDDLSRENYVVADGYLIFVVDGKLVRIEKDRWEAICRDYSSYGGDLTQAETARKHGIPLPWMRRVLRAYGHYKASPPMSRERIAEAEDLEPLIAEAVENKEYELLQKIDRRQDQRIRREWRELKEWRQREERFIEAGRRVAENLPELQLPEPALQSPATWPAAVAITTDEQLGRPTWGEGVWGEDYDSDIGGRRIVGVGRVGSAWVADQGGAETVYRAYNGDFFEGLTGETAHETAMDLDTRFERTWDIALQAVIADARLWRRVCERLVLIFVKGNHDKLDTHKFASALKYALEGDGVEVRATPKMYDSVRVGDSLHVFDHGYKLAKISGWKAKVQAEKVARKVAGEDYHGAEHIFYHVGHKHDRMVVSSGDHMEIIRHPALCETSDWEHEGRYITKPCADVMLLDERGRIDTPKRLYRDALDVTPQSTAPAPAEPAQATG